MSADRADRADRAAMMRRIEAQQRTIEVLMRRVRQQDAEGVATAGTVRNNVDIERLIARHTEQLRRQREEQTAALELIRALMANVPDVVVQVDLDGRIVFANRGLPADNVGRVLWELNPETAGDAEANTRAAMRGPHTWDLELVSGAITACRAGPVRKGDRIIGAVIVGRDVAEERKTHHELQMATSQLMQAQKLTAIGQLAAGIAHEINTPVQFVSDNTFFLQRAFERILDLVDQVATADASRLEEVRAAVGSSRVRKLREQIPRAIAQSLEGLGRVSKLVSAMKEFSHPSHGTKEPVDLARALETTATIARNEWKYVADLDIHVAPDLPRISLLRDEFNQVVLNLIVNAAHAIAEKYPTGDARGRITITAAQEGEHVAIRFTDDGCGIPEAFRQKVFEPFFTTKGVGKGTGQGLAIAYGVIVEKHRGTLEVTSEVGRGTTFLIRLPLFGGLGARPAG